MGNFYRTFDIDKKIISRLSKENQEVLKILSEVVKDAGAIYERQIKEGFFPKGVSKEEIERAAVKDQEVLSPFTQVIKKRGELKAIPDNIAYQDLLAPISEKILKAADVTRNSSFKKYLKARAGSLIKGSYEEADITWLDVKNIPIDFSVGPFERYLDKLFFIKRIFQAHVGIVNGDLSKEAEEIREVLYASAKINIDKQHSTEIPKKGVTISVQRTPATSGFIAEILVSGEHFPCDLELMLKYGSKTIIYLDQLKLKFEKLHYPVFQALFEKRFASKYSKDVLLQASIRLTELYELARQLHKFSGSRKRLKEIFGVIDEGNKFVSGVQHSKNLVLKGVINQDELEALMIMHIVWMFSDWLIYKENSSEESNVKGAAIILNYYFETGALREKAGISWPNFSKMFFSIEQLAEIFSELLQYGDYQKAVDFINGRASFKNFEKLSKNLKDIKY